MQLEFHLESLAFQRDRLGQRVRRGLQVRDRLDI